MVARHSSSARKNKFLGLEENLRTFGWVCQVYRLHVSKWRSGSPCQNITTEQQLPCLKLERREPESFGSKFTCESLITEKEFKKVCVFIQIVDRNIFQLLRMNRGSGSYVIYLFTYFWDIVRISHWHWQACKVCMHMLAFWSRECSEMLRTILKEKQHSFWCTLVGVRYDSEDIFKQKGGWHGDWSLCSVYELLDKFCPILGPQLSQSPVLRIFFIHI